MSFASVVADTRAPGEPVKPNICARMRLDQPLRHGWPTSRQRDCITTFSSSSGSAIAAGT
jgi:hypothetical protein